MADVRYPALSGRFGTPRANRAPGRIPAVRPDMRTAMISPRGAFRTRGGVFYYRWRHIAAVRVCGQFCLHVARR